MPHIIVSGAIANKPANGGEAWVRLSWLIGFWQIGCDVHFVEQIDAAACCDEQGNRVPPLESRNVSHFRHVLEQAGWSERAFLVDEQGEILVGPNSNLGPNRSSGGNGNNASEPIQIPLTPALSKRERGKKADSNTGDLNAILDRADLLVNISGHLHCERIFSRLRHKAYIDIDPGFTQFWHAEGNAGARLAGHDFFFTIGENIGTAACPIPTTGIPWQAVRQPVVIDDWQFTEKETERTDAMEQTRPRFTTIASWRGAFGAVEFGGRRYGLKCHEFRKVLELPRRVPNCDFEIALDIHPADERDRNALLEHGWKIVDPRAVASDVITFRDYVQQSSAEFSVAQGIYAETQSGWFSDRTVRYLAAGKPALVQETGFGRHLPTGEGLLSFRNLDEATAGAAEISADYPRHSQAARRIAAEFFDARVVLPRFLSACGVGGGGG